MIDIDKLKKKKFPTAIQSTLNSSKSWTWMMRIIRVFINFYCVILIYRECVNSDKRIEKSRQQLANNWQLKNALLRKKRKSLKKGMLVSRIFWVWENPWNSSRGYWVWGTRNQNLPLNFINKLVIKYKSFFLVSLRIK